jgi:hypothetical protein
LTIPDNPEAASFFRKKLGFSEVTGPVGSSGQMYVRTFDVIILSCCFVA